MTAAMSGMIDSPSACHRIWPYRMPMRRWLRPPCALELNMTIRPLTASLALLFALLLALLASTAHAAPLLRCQIEQGGAGTTIDTVPVADPYTVPARDINGHFRFKAVVIGDAAHVEYVKLYVYATTKRQPLLLHETVYLAPVARRDAAPGALTGVNYVYAPNLERELQYRCALLEVTP